jgi:hypothetical protein
METSTFLEWFIGILIGLIGGSIIGGVIVAIFT